LVAKELEGKGFEVTLKLNVTSSQLKSVLEEFYVVKGADKNARLMVWFAGHGETVGGEGYLVPIDAPRNSTGPQFKLRALSLRRFGEFVRQAEAKHAMAVFDSCFAGTIFGTTRDKPPPAVTRSTGLPVRQFLTSGDAGESVSDDGTFRKLFIRALRGEERADANGDGYLTGSELGNYLGDRVVNLQIGQTPRYGKLRDPDYDRGDFVFALGQPTSSVAAPKSGSGFKLDDLQDQQKQEQIKQAWATKLAEMKAAYQQAQKFDEGSASAELKVTAWQRFVTAFAEDNPFSEEDDLIRRLGASRAEHWMSRQVASVTTTPPKPKASSPINPAVGLFAGQYRPGDTFKDCDDCPEMVVVPAGKFQMGDLNGAGRNSELPVHQVTIPRPFAVGKFEVTQAQWSAVMGNNRSEFKGNHRPVEKVSWNDVQEYLKKLNSRLWLTDKQHRYRLLSESEWEYVARAGTTTKYHFGNSISRSQASYDVNFKEGTANIGSYQPNEFGLYDMHGNVEEWVEDCWSANYSGAPTDGSAWLKEKVNCSYRRLRGGSWVVGPRSVRIAGRNYSNPQSRGPSFGFRVARSLPQPLPAMPIKPAVGVYPSKYKPGDNLKDCDECPEMVVVPAGTFRMGDLSGDGISDEKPVHRVTISHPFAVGKFEVTQAEWQAVMGNNPSGFKGNNRPVEYVSWDEVQGYLKRLNDRLGLGGRPDRYRLLSESEWEYAARAGTTTKYPFGNSISLSQAKYRGWDRYRGWEKHAVNVGSYPPNVFGLHDMIGNVWEWVEDCWNVDYWAAPADGSAWKTGNCRFRVLRGGSFFDNRLNLRTSSRNRSNTLSRVTYLGFRVARTLPR